MLERDKSLTQNIDNLFFVQNAPLSREYNFLFRSLFNEATLHRQIIEALASKASGLTRTEIMATTKIEVVVEETFHRGRMLEPA